MTVGERIQQYRKERNLSQEELGQRLLVSRQTVSQWETDQTLPTVDNLLRLKEVFGVSIDTLLCGDSVPETAVKAPRRTRKKVLIILLSVLAGVALLTGLLIGLCKTFLPHIYYRCYLGDRITGTVTVTVDGEPYSLKTGSITPYDDSAIWKKPRVNYLRDGSARVRIHAGRYGMYGFYLTIDDVVQPICITAYQFNWWNVTNFDLSVSMDTAANTVTLHTDTVKMDEIGSPYIYHRTETFQLSDPEIGFSIVNG